MDPKPNKERLQAGLDAAAARERKAMENAAGIKKAAKDLKEPKPKKLSEILERRSGIGGEVRKKSEPRPMAKKEKMPKKMMGGGMMKSKMGTKGGAMGGKKKPPGYKEGKTVGGKFPDLTGDGKVTKKDVLKGRGVPGFKKGGMKPKGAAAGGGYKKGGKVRGAGIARKGVRPVKFR